MANDENEETPIATVRRDLEAQKLATILAGGGLAAESADLWASLMKHRIRVQANGVVSFEGATSLDDLAEQAARHARNAGARESENGTPESRAKRPGATAHKKPANEMTIREEQAQRLIEKQSAENEFVIRTQFGGDVEAWQRAEAASRVSYGI